MSDGYSPAISDGLLNAAFRNVPYTGPASWNVKLHLGDPGAGGLAAPSLTVLRKNVTWTAPGGTGVVRSVADLIWTPAQTVADEWVKFISYWSALTVGTWQGNAAINVLAHTTATGLILPAGTITATQPTAV